MALKLTVVIRDPSPMIHFQDPPSHRTVVLQLTDEQIEKLTLQYRGQSGHFEIYEEIAYVIFEGDEALRETHINNGPF